MSTDDRPGLHLIKGGGEIVGFLERLLDMAKGGRIDTIAVAIAESDGTTGTGLAFRDCAVPFPRTVGAVDVLRHDLHTGRLGFEA